MFTLLPLANEEGQKGSCNLNGRKLTGRKRGLVGLKEQ